MTAEPKYLGAIHPADDMFNAWQYIYVSFSAVYNIEASLLATGKSLQNVKNCLDFASGYGRVLRLLVPILGASKVNACDLNTDAISFCNNEFGVTGFHSHEDFDQVVFPKKYDLIWVGSLFTHIDARRFAQLLRALYGALEDGGMLVFSTHGRHSLTMLNFYGVYFPNDIYQLINDGGYYYIDYPGRTNYGISVCHENYVIGKINELGGELIRYAFKGWAEHHDVFSLRRIK